MFKKFFQKFRKKARSQASAQTSSSSATDRHPSKFNTLIKMPSLILHPGDMMEELGIAICMNERSAAAFSSDMIDLYEVFLPESNQTISFFGLERNGFVYGNIIGSPYICVCPENAYDFKPIECFDAPFADKGSCYQVLHCRFNKKCFGITVESFDQIDKTTQDRKTLLLFEGCDRSPAKALRLIERYNA